MYACIRYVINGRPSLFCQACSAKGAAKPALPDWQTCSLFYAGCTVCDFVKKGQAVLGSPIMAGSVSAVCVCQPIYSARASLPQVCCRAEQGCLHESGSGAMHGCVCLQCMSLSVYVSVHGMSVSVCVSVCLALPRCDSRKNRPGCSRAAGLAGLCLLCMLTLCAAWQGLRASCQAAYSKRLAQAEGIGAVLLLMLQLCCMLYAACCNYAALHAVCCSVVHCAAPSALHNAVCCMACCMLLCLLCILCAAWHDVCCSAVHCAALSALHCPAAYQAVLCLIIPSGCLSGCRFPQAARSGCGCLLRLLTPRLAGRAASC